MIALVGSSKASYLHVLRVPGRDLLGWVAEPEDLFDLFGCPQRDWESGVEPGLVPVHLAQREDLDCEFAWTDRQSWGAGGAPAW
jgi:hypothetical protein